MDPDSTQLSLEAGPGHAPQCTTPFAQYGKENWKIRSRRVPWTLGKYVGLEALRSVILFVLLVSVMYSAMVTFQTIRSGIQLAFIWPFLIKTFAYPLFFSLPLALLAGITLTYGRMSADLEVAAIRCHGASHLQLLGPVLALADLRLAARRCPGGVDGGCRAVSDPTAQRLAARRRASPCLMDTGSLNQNIGPSWQRGREDKRERYSACVST